MQNNPQLVKVSFHGHSSFSDGLSSVSDLVEEAYRCKIDYFGISDHNTIKQIRSFYQFISMVNSGNGRAIIPVMASEVKFFNFGQKFELLFAKIGSLDEKFLDWLDNVIKNRQIVDPVQVVIEAVEKFDAIVTVVHPGMAYAASANKTYIRFLSEELPEVVKKNVCLEVRNWTANIFPNNISREKDLPALADRYGFAQIGMSDFHHLSDIKNEYSVASVEEVTAEGLIKAIQNHQIAPSRTVYANLLEKMKIGLIIFRASVRKYYQKLNGVKY